MEVIRSQENYLGALQIQDCDQICSYKYKDGRGRDIPSRARYYSTPIESRET